jgi:hypothetical protein
MIFKKRRKNGNKIFTFLSCAKRSVLRFVGVCRLRTVVKPLYTLQKTSGSIRNIIYIDYTDQSQKLLSKLEKKIYFLHVLEHNLYGLFPPNMFACGRNWNILEC